MVNFEAERLFGDAIFFDTGKDVIKPESEPLLAEVLKLLGDNPGLKLSIEGHTDNQGIPKSNQTLSGKRAESVKKYLVGQGHRREATLDPGLGRHETHRRQPY